MMKPPFKTAVHNPLSGQYAIVDADDKMVAVTRADGAQALAAELVIRLNAYVDPAVKKDWREKNSTLVALQEKLTKAQTYEAAAKMISKAYTAGLSHEQAIEQLRIEAADLRREVQGDSE